jgi:hypothetical protein
MMPLVAKLTRAGIGAPAVGDPVPPNPLPKEPSNDAVSGDPRPPIASINRL